MLAKNVFKLLHLIWTISLKIIFLTQLNQYIFNII